MTKRDRELLDKQMRRFAPAPRGNGVVILTIVAVFFAGIALGGNLFPRKNVPARTASRDVMAAIFTSNGASPIVRR